MKKKPATTYRKSAISYIFAFFKVHFTTKQMVLLWVFPLGPVLANLFMGYYQTMWLNTFCVCEIILYRRYVDDIICIESDADKFFEFLNSRYPNIKFTFEKKVNKQISFLNVLITNDGINFALPFSAKKLRLAYLLII